MAMTGYEMNAVRRMQRKKYSNKLLRISSNPKTLNGCPEGWPGVTQMLPYTASYI
ncbi:MAG: hypothetical protein ACI9S8_002303, partial [Chlamydiales bacterium]